MIGCLNQAERSRLQELRLVRPFVDEALCQLERMLASRTFARVQRRAKDFLTLVVIKKLLDQAHQIKETTIAIAVFDESAAFDPMTNSKIRVAASDLRRRLTGYYAGEGRSDPIEIVIPLATYVPDIRDRRISIAVNTFENWHPADDQAHLCCSLSADIVYWLNRANRVRATRSASVGPAAAATRYSLRGSLEPRASILGLNVSLADVEAGRILYSHTFKSRRNEAFTLTREVAKTVMRVLQRRDYPGGAIEAPSWRLRS